MHKHLSLWVVMFLFSELISAQMTVKDSDTNILMQVNDEGSVGSITVPSGSAPSAPTNKLYNISGSLYWSGEALATSGSAGGWTDDGGILRLTTGTDNVGIGTSSPGARLHLKGTGFPSSFIFLQSETGGSAGFRLYEGTAVKWHIFNRRTLRKKGHYAPFLRKCGGQALRSA